jgi:protein-S-isoprenylcysteine O-methyltransferase Ste14
VTFHATIDKAEADSVLPQKASPLDIAERVFLFITLGWFIARLSFSLKTEPANILIMICETIPVLMLVIRKPGLIATSVYAWAIAIIGTFTPLLVTVSGAALVSAGVSDAMMLLGLTIAIAAKVCLNRSFGIVAANRGVKRQGPYRFVRHPMYLGYIVTQAGFLLAHCSLSNVLIYVVAWTACALRIREEERFLTRDGAYRDYSAAVRYRIIPGVI